MRKGWLLPVFPAATIAAVANLDMYSFLKKIYRGFVPTLQWMRTASSHLLPMVDMGPSAWSFCWRRELRLYFPTKQVARHMQTQAMSHLSVWRSEWKTKRVGKRRHHARDRTRTVNRKEEIDEFFAADGQERFIRVRIAYAKC